MSIDEQEPEEGPKVISMREARLKAEEVLAFEIGNLPHLGDAEETEEVYVFPLVTTMPRVIFDENRERPVDVKFMSEEEVGEIRIDSTTGEVADRSHVYEIERRIRRQQKEVEDAVEKALVRSSAGRFSKLPFPEHRYTPILDILSHLILEGPIEEGTFNEMNGADKEKYHEYAEMLEGVSLVRKRGDDIIADDIFIEIQADQDTRPEMLNAALAHFFEEGAENIKTIREILGPYLVLAGHYYQEALLVDNGSPSISEKEFREEIEKTYSGNNRAQKKFKLSRYMIQLEEVDLLESDTEREGAWIGNDDVKQNLLRQGDMLSPISDVMA